MTSTAAVGLGVFVGVPFGVGRALARALHLVAHGRVPALTILRVAIGALALANVVAAFPGHQVACVPATLVLRGEEGYSSVSIGGHEQNTLRSP